MVSKENFKVVWEAGAGFPLQKLEHTRPAQGEPARRGAALRAGILCKSGQSYTQD